VATGADLVAYSGFSASNYLEQPYNSDLDFGTGDFCVMGWVKAASGSAKQTVISRYAATGNGGLEVYLDSSEKLQFRITSNDWSTAPRLESASSLTIGSWTHFCCFLTGEVMYTFLNGVLSATRSGSGGYNISNALASTFVGVEYSTAYQFDGSLALLRISATAPTAEQIKKIYEDEKVLFQENAQATLYGSSDAVTALAHDSDTNLLHVGTSQGRSVFKGLRRVSNTTTGVGTAISASGGMVVEE
jgi:hypothetical protein